MPALKGIKSICSKADISSSSIGRSIWESSIVRPIPGKCLATAMMLLDCKYSMTFPPSRVTQAGSPPNALCAMMLLIPSGATSMTGAMFMLIPTRVSSVAVTSAKWMASSSLFIWGFPGNCVKGSLSLATCPPSWSTAMNNGGCPHSRA